MGLDSVDLLMSFEEQFEIQIPNSEAENILTINDMVDAIYNKIKINPNDTCISQLVFYRIRNDLIQLGISRDQITVDSKISELLKCDDLSSQWLELEQKLELNIPKLHDLDIDKTLNKEVRFLGFKIFDRKEPIAQNTLKKFTHWVVSLNHAQLIKLDNISSKYEIERIICIITEERTGIPLSEIEPHHSFHNDLGID